MTVRRLLAEVDSRELTEWRAFELIYPFDADRDDLRAGIVASAVRGYPVTPGDCVPNYLKLAQDELDDQADIGTKLAKVFAMIKD